MAPVIIRFDKTLTLGRLDLKIVAAKHELEELRQVTVNKQTDHENQVALQKSRQRALAKCLMKAHGAPTGHAMLPLKFYRMAFADQGSPPQVLKLESLLCQHVHLMEVQERSKVILSEKSTDLISSVEGEIKHLESTFSENEVVWLNRITQRRIGIEKMRTSFQNLVSAQNFVISLLNEQVRGYSLRSTPSTKSRGSFYREEPMDDDGAFVADLVSSFSTLKTLLDDEGKISRRNEEVEFIDETDWSMSSPVSVRSTFFSSMR
mmetsp:Transcript_49203/g.73350  ORF Transcript_49203/g.73350 Transcript_49203/m.73350 type:complete len:263 (-) Transcript_49203:691-1479(-)|eukprot:CAMPEP_0194046860 /NCGR_PEP_ID=MMETSP0009_2-20130614/22722_1 /TAXON_ID=210454 /ORGANISM="Grammatophora oceanica, Strain CCMP 410" /LENGTH=262 /DNA_ID=CAMNT_0038692315 /DNA_START=83 /DNA_END=871 /DNA_ORIENTATION=+